MIIKKVNSRKLQLRVYFEKLQDSFDMVLGFNSKVIYCIVSLDKIFLSQNFLRNMYRMKNYSPSSANEIISEVLP